ncbi:YadA-like family protein [Fusobacterium necrophorum]|uniref:YadA-like family protein n=1 Tax=Fusobacterium necrophorum TaxID=859 RepID=UPI0021C422D2|nr:YadA-like family protein [Fusobacterium necrophorum]
MNNMYLKNVEKWLKHSLKKRISINTGMLVAFLITGFLGFTGEALADESMQKFKWRIASDILKLKSSTVNLNSGFYQDEGLGDQFNVISGSQGDNMQLSYVNGRFNTVTGPSNYVGFKRKTVIIDSEVSDDGRRMIHGPNFDPKGNTYYWFNKGDILQNVTFSAKFLGGQDFIEGIGKNGEVVRYNVGDKIDYIKLTENRRLYLSGNLKDSLFNINSYFFKKDQIREKYNDTMSAGNRVEGAVVNGFAAGIEGGANYAVAVGAYSRVTEGSEGSVALGAYSVADSGTAKGYIDDQGRVLKRLKNGKFYLEEQVQLGTDGETLELKDKNTPEVDPSKVTQLMGVIAVGGERTLLNADGTTPTIKVRRRLEGVAPGKEDDDAITIGQIKLLLNGKTTVAYTDPEGNRVTKAIDGNYYLEKDVDPLGNVIKKEGEPVPQKIEKVLLSLVNPDGTTKVEEKDGRKVAKTILRNVGDPTEDTDAANKKYVDQEVASIGNLGFTGDNSTSGTVNLKEKQKLAINGTTDYIVTKAEDQSLTIDLAQGVKNTLKKVPDIENKINELETNKPFEYFRGDDKVVRGQDGKFYKDSDLEGAIYDKDSNTYSKPGTQLVAIDSAEVVIKAIPKETEMKVTNIKAGDVKVDSKDAINGGQLYTTNKAVADTLGGDAKVNEQTGEITGPTYTLKDPDGVTGKETKEYKNVGDALKALDGVNKKQDEKIEANSKLKFKTDKEKDSDPALEHSLTDVLNLKGDSNISVTSKDKDNIQIALKDDISVKTIKVGETDTQGNLTNGVKAGKDGISYTAEDGTKIVINKDGIDAGSKKITNVADPTEDTDAANKKYVDGKVKGISDVIGSGKDGRDGKDGKDGAGQYGPSGKDGLNGKDLTEKVNAIRNGEAGAVVYTDKDGNRLAKANDGKYYLADKVKKDGSTEAGATAVETKDIRLSLVNSEGETTKPTVLANVEDGKIAENSKDAVNGGQIHKNNEEIASIFGGGAKFENGAFVKPSYEVTGEKGKKKYDNVGDALAALEWMNNAQEGKIAANSKFKFITDEGEVREHTLTDNLNIKGDKNISVSSKDKDNIQIALKDDISVKTIKAGETDDKGNFNGVEAGKDGISYKDKDGKTIVAITKDGIDAGSKKITNVADPEKDTDAANKKYVDAQVKGISDVIGNGKDGRDGKDGKDGAGQYGPSGKDGLNGKDLTEKVNAIRNGEAGAVVYTDKDGNRLAKANDGKYYLADKVKKDGSTEAGATAVETKDIRLSLVNSEGETTKPTILANVADGKVEKGSKEAVNGGQLAETNGKVEQLENTVAANSKFKFTTDEGEAREHSLTDNLNIKGDNNISVTSKDKDNIQIALKDDISVKTIKAGATDDKGNLTSGVTAGKEGLMYKSEDGTKIVINKDGIDAGDKKISHVADGKVSEDSQDAVNGKQLYATNQRIDEIENVNKKVIEKVNNNSHRIDKLDKKVNKGLANAAAMSGVEFMDIGVNQATVAAAVGGYKGTQAVAVGVQGAPTENIRINAKMALTPGSHVESMYSVGAAYRFNFK